MKIKKVGCLRSFLVGLSALVILCLIVVGLVTWDNTHLPERSKIMDRLTQQENDLLIKSQHLRQTIVNEVLPGWDRLDGVL